MSFLSQASSFSQTIFFTIKCAHRTSALKETFFPRITQSRRAGGKDRQPGAVMSSMSSRAPGAGGASTPPLVDKEVDFANYFCTYGYLYHQKEMLSDRVRMDAYYDAVFNNAAVHFRDKVSLHQQFYFHTNRPEFDFFTRGKTQGCVGRGNRQRDSCHLVRAGRREEGLRRRSYQNVRSCPGARYSQQCRRCRRCHTRFH